MREAPMRPGSNAAPALVGGKVVVKEVAYVRSVAVDQWAGVANSVRQGRTVDVVLVPDIDIAASRDRERDRGVCGAVKVGCARRGKWRGHRVVERVGKL